MDRMVTSYADEFFDSSGDHSVGHASTGWVPANESAASNVRR